MAVIGLIGFEHLSCISQRRMDGWIDNKNSICEHHIIAAQQNVYSVYICTPTSVVGLGPPTCPSGKICIMLSRNKNVTVRGRGTTLFIIVG